MNAAKRHGKPGELVFLPLGGAGEIGMNMYLYGHGTARRRSWIMVDCGVKFADERNPGIDVILPDTSYIEANRKDLLGIIVTHGHEDHLGALAWLWPRLQAPVYCTPFTAELLKRKFDEAGLLGEVPLRVVLPGSHIELGSFDIELVSVTHSIPEPNALAIRTPSGTVVHSGDWKLDRAPQIPPHMDEARLREIGDEGVDALICDSTNVLREGVSPSEADVAATLTEIIANAPHRVAVTTFASHVGRMECVIRAARQAGREVVVAGRAMRTMIDAAREVGLLKDAGQLLEPNVFGFLPASKVLLLCTGSQGEPRAALARIAADSHPEIALENGDTVVFSSKTIPGNEKAVTAIHNNLAGLGVEIVTSDEALVHSSGHPREGELEQLYEWVRPRLLVPMHGEMRHLQQHTLFAEKCGIAEAVLAVNGDMVRLAPGPGEIIDEAPAGTLHVDGRLIVPSFDGPARFRRKLSFAGVVFVSLVVGDNGRMDVDPQITLEGIPEEAESGQEMSDYLLDIVDQSFGAIPRARRMSDDVVMDTVRSAVRRAGETAWGKRPICRVTVHRV